jgi:hypothetical protein
MAARDDLGLVRSARPTDPDDSAGRDGLAAMRRRRDAGLFTELDSPGGKTVEFQITDHGRAVLAEHLRSKGLK